MLSDTSKVYEPLAALNMVCFTLLILTPHISIGRVIVRNKAISLCILQ